MLTSRISEKPKFSKMQKSILRFNISYGRKNNRIAFCFFLRGFFLFFYYFFFFITIYLFNLIILKFEKNFFGREILFFEFLIILIKKSVCVVRLQKIIWFDMIEFDNFIHFRKRNKYNRHKICKERLIK